MDSKTKTLPLARKATQMTQLQHVKAKSMWAGSKTPQTIESYVLTRDEEKNNRFVLTPLKYPPALLKIIDEVIVNAIDHHSHYSKMVSEIKISLDKQTGVISVFNNGPGIPIELTKNTQNVEMYTPQLIASEFLAGDNLNDSGDNIKGGTNGLGLKLTVAFSTSLTVETADGKQTYKQTFRPGVSHIECDIPEITSIKSTPFTKITFLPNYEEFQFDFAKNYNTLFKILQTRSWQAAAYTSACIYYNDKAIVIKSFQQYCEMFTENEVICAKMTFPACKYVWDVGFAVSDGKATHNSLVNGVHISKGGTHIDHIANKLVDYVRDPIEKEIKKTGAKFNKSYVLNNTSIFMKGSIPSPEFTSQTKEAISDSEKKFTNYDLTNAQWAKIYDLLKIAILEVFLKKQLGEIKTRANRGKVNVPKYTEATFCRDKKKYMDCGLIITEGDSASGTARKGLLSEKTGDKFTFNWFGLFSIGGVPINGLKESNELMKKVAPTLIPKKRIKASTNDLANTKDLTNTKLNPIKGKKSVKESDFNESDFKESDFNESDFKEIDFNENTNIKRIPTSKLLNNERISSLIKVLGLDFNKTYDFTDKGESEWKTLRYGFIVGLTDQDLDGFNIYGLVCTFLISYWPNLTKRKFLRRINTPVIRAIPNSNKLETHEFYTELEARTWMDTIGESVVKSKYKISYYKGLGSHRESHGEITQMFSDINDKIKIYNFDPNSMVNMICYYGKDTSLRKTALADPVIPVASENLEVPISEIFTIDTKLFQRDNIVRKLFNLVDGLVPSRRKVFYVARKNGNNEIKVQGLAGKAVSDADYHHGESSLEQTITRMAQAYPAARNLPLLLPLGEFGNRSAGYKDAAASRYIFTKINSKLADKLFRKEDDYILQYEVSDGHRYEPKFYIPIIPYVLCENNQLPATGWAVDIHARDIKAIFQNIRDMIAGKITKCKKLPMWLKDFTGEIRRVKNKDYYVGKYSYDEETNSILITELPIGSYSNGYLFGNNADKVSKKESDATGISGKEYVYDVKDETTNDKVSITIWLKPDSYEKILEEYGDSDFDAIEVYFELKESISNFINLVNEDNKVIEYTSYEDVFNDWFNYRKQLYTVRIDRELILNDLEILKLKNIQRFSKEHSKFQINNKTSEEEFERILIENKYDIFNHVYLENPQYTSINILKSIIIDKQHGANHEYLMKLNYRDLTEESYNKRQARIEELQERLKYLLDDSGAFKGAAMWLKELDELEQTIHRGIESEWFYGENKPKFAKKAPKKVGKILKKY